MFLLFCRFGNDGDFMFQECILPINIQRRDLIVVLPSDSRRLQEVAFLQTGVLRATVYCTSVYVISSTGAAKSFPPEVKRAIESVLPI
jgi:hypothetical protein